jgi:hypothetical protein
VGVNWAFGIYRHLSAPGPNSLKSQRLPFAVYLHQSPPANCFDGKSDGKISLGALLPNFTVRRASGMRESLQIKPFSPLRIVGLGKL